MQLGGDFTANNLPKTIEVDDMGKQPLTMMAPFRQRFSASLFGCESAQLLGSVDGLEAVNP